ncbi:MAG TPA: glutathione S-transferase family protein [Burkholderiaceae bacterium]|jgi:glutathione S-transferase|nr:glutathione S-transferase family protein [Burkholderiaceae bacterium]
MYTLHIGNKNYSSWSLRPWALLRSLNIPFQEQMHFFESGSNAERFRQFSPSARVPCLQDGSTVVWDSLAIAEYVAERHPHVWAAAPASRAWSRCACAEMHAGFADLRSQCSMSIGVRIRLHTVTDGLRSDLQRLQELWSDGLRRFGGPWLAGSEFTAVDAYFAPVAFRIQTYELQLADPCRSYAHALLGHPVLQEWQAAALAETQRDEPHEVEILEVGTLLADHRAR